MGKHDIYCLMLGTCLMACSQPFQNNGIAIDLDGENQKEIRFSSFVDSISYIPLETREDCLIGKIEDIILSDSILFVLNEEQNTIFQFDRQGKFLRKIAKAGNGPGEYPVINQMAYNEKRQSISLASSKIIEYDLYGNLKNEFTVPFYVSDLYQFDNGDYLLSRFDRLNEPNVLLALVDTTGYVKKELFNRNPQYGIETNNLWELIPLDDGIHFITPQIENTVYSYEEDSIKNVLSFNISPQIPSDFYKSKRDIPLLGNHYYRTIYRESQNWINLIFCTLEKVRTLLYNKRTKQYMLGEVFKNDMDDKKQIFFLSHSKGNTFTNYVKADDEEDNPVIQILHLKH